MADEYLKGAHDTVDALINMFETIHKSPIIGSAMFLTKIVEIKGDPYISIENMIQLLRHHQLRRARAINNREIKHEEENKRLRGPEDT